MAKLKSVGYGSKINKYGVRFTKSELEKYQKLRKSLYDKQRYLAKKRLKEQNEKYISPERLKQTAKRNYYEFNPPQKIKDIRSKKTFKNQIRTTKIKLTRKIRQRVANYRKNYVQSLRTAVKSTRIKNKTSLYQQVNNIDAKLKTLTEFQLEQFFEDVPNIEYNYENEISKVLEMIWQTI